ncbi:MAG: type I pullulanase [Sphingobacteriales bacterium]|nr:type I pullulanase [Sphingobacteriales bacterium]
MILLLAALFMLKSISFPALLHTYFSDKENEPLGLQYHVKSSTFSVWSPEVRALKLLLYEAGTAGEAFAEHHLKKGKNGVWHLQLKGDWKGKYYAFQAQYADGSWGQAVPDPYAKAVGTNGMRAQIIDLAATNPIGWEQDRRPPLSHFCDIILYEAQVRDLSIAPNSGVQHKGKFLGLCEADTRSPEGESTVLAHFKELGITHLHLLPVFDFGSVDESRLHEAQYNWGYDPVNYNAPEGSYSTDPADAAVRIHEMKQMVQTLHQNGLRVVMDVVYNHTYRNDDALFEQLAPHQYYRFKEDGTYSNGSGCGNEIASEQPRVRQLIVESVVYWAKEYHIDGFRFDLMGLLDKETMLAVRAALDEIDPTIFIYGEGWTGGDSTLPAEQRCLKSDTHELPRIAAFSDDLRDAIKGGWWSETDPGFVQGKDSLEESLKFGIVAATTHQQINYEQVNYSKKAWAAEPYQCINYCSCHDNHTLWDKLLLSAPDAPEQERIKMDLLAQIIVLTSQGVPLLHAGEEMLRSKGGEHNSYQSPDSVNQIDWSRKRTYKNVFSFYKNLIALRKAHPAFRLKNQAMIQKHLRFWQNMPSQVVAYTLHNHANNDEWENISVLFNGSKKAITVMIPETYKNKEYTVIVEGEQINLKGLSKRNAPAIQIPAIGAVILKH